MSEKQRFEGIFGELETENTSKDKDVISLKLKFNPKEKGFMFGILDTKHNKMLAISYTHDKKRINRLKKDIETLNLYARDL